VESLGVLIHNIPSADSASIIYTFPICMAFISFSCLIAVTDDVLVLFLILEEKLSAFTIECDVS